MANSKLRARLGSALKPWHVREKILAPLIANLLTALLIFLGALPFRSTIRAFFGNTIPFPISCAVEPLPQGERNKVVAEFFIMNTTSQPWSDWTLRQLLKGNSSDANVHADPYIRIRSNTSSSRIESVVADTEYNRDKGYLSVRENGGEWIIEITHIQPLSMLKVIVTTDRLATVSSRGSRTTLPIEWRSPAQISYE
jgi:hypothetical protein